MAELTENPFASTHSLDTNPFDDPVPQPQSSFPSETHDARLAAINERERDLERREQELSAKVEHVRSHGKSNWPFFFPLIYHHIAEEIPEASRPTMTRIYQLWLVLLGTLIINFVASLFILLGGGPEGGADLGGSIGYIFIIGPLSFLLWYRPIYNAYMKEQSLYYYIYFFFAGWHLLFSVYMIIGVPGTGAAGLINTIQAYAQGSLAAGILGTIATVGWVIQGLGNAFYYRQIWAHHTAAGHSMDKAKSELASHGAKAYFTRG